METTQFNFKINDEVLYNFKKIALENRTSCAKLIRDFMISKINQNENGNEKETE